MSSPRPAPDPRWLALDAVLVIAFATIGRRSHEEGLALVNGTAVLVMAYTLGGVLAPGLGGLALQLSPAVGFPALLLLIAGVGVAALHARRLRW